MLAPEEVTDFQSAVNFIHSRAVPPDELEVSNEVYNSIIAAISKLRTSDPMLQPVTGLNLRLFSTQIILMRKPFKIGCKVIFVKPGYQQLGMIMARLGNLYLIQMESYGRNYKMDIGPNKWVKRSELEEY